MNLFHRNIKRGVSLVQLILISVSPLFAQYTAKYNPIPAPQQIEHLDSTPFVLSDGVTIVCRTNDSRTLSSAKYLQQALSDCGIKATIGKGSQGIILGKKANKKASKEAYTINVNRNAVSIDGNGDAGVFYGVQTLCQTICSAIEESNSAKSIILPAVKISDTPRFQYRGFMLDVSRHFFDKDFVKKQIDAMAHYKLNRLHMHLTDAGGWRFEIKSHPELTQKTAYRTQVNWREWWDKGYDRRYAEIGTTDSYGGYFTQDDMREIIDYASKRHITIIPEIEMPGHCQEVFFAHPELCCTGNFLNTGDVCVGNDAVFDFFTDILKEITELFPSEYIHIGGDEASKHTWPTCEKCQERIRKEGLKDVDELQSWFIHRIEEIVNGLGKKIIGWDEILEGGLTPGATVMSWRGESGGIKAAEAGHQVIMTPGNPLYLDMYQDAPPFCPEAQGGYYPLDKVYAYDPVGSISDEAAHLVYGVQGNLWTERVETPQHVEYMMWPRLMAIAEVGWTNLDRKDYDDFHKRALREVAHLKNAGYHPFDLKNEVGNRREFYTPIRHLALNKTVKYNLPYAPQYRAADDATLTDGLRGGWMYGDGRWQGFIERGRFDVIIDLESQKDIHDVYATFMQMVGPDVFYPGEVEILISNDGKNFSSLQKLHYEPNREEVHGFRDFGWHGKASARYIQYKADCSKHRGWLFTDEIIVE